MISVWRLVKSEHVHTAFTGEGARLFGGRWNEVGTLMVYTSGSLSLSTLELFVNLDASPPSTMNLMSIEALIPKEIIIEAKDIPKEWNSIPVESASQNLGSQWVIENKSAVLKVPSAIIPNEYNYLLNPNHKDFQKIKIKDAEAFSIDNRMWK